MLRPLTAFHDRTPVSAIRRAEMAIVRPVCQAAGSVDAGRDGWYFNPRGACAAHLSSSMSTPGVAAIARKTAESAPAGMPRAMPQARAPPSRAAPAPARPAGPASGDRAARCAAARLWKEERIARARCRPEENWTLSVQAVRDALLVVARQPHDVDGTRLTRHNPASPAGLDRDPGRPAARDREHRFAMRQRCCLVRGPSALDQPRVTQQCQYLPRQRHRLGGVAVNAQRRLLGNFAGVADTGELLDLAGEGLRVKALAVARLAHRQRGVEVDLDEVAMRLDQFRRLGAGVRAGWEAIIRSVATVRFVASAVWQMVEWFRSARKGQCEAVAGQAMPCSPHSRLSPKKRVSSTSMPGSQRWLVWPSPIDT
jgi:hypothetical protein